VRLMQSEVSYDLARQQRKSKNPWEAKIWRCLRNRKFYGFKFKRQVRIGVYIVDFCCDEKRLIIELDGGQHNSIDAKIKDLEREVNLKNKDYKIMRFWNNEIDNNMEGVLENIRKFLLD